MASGDLPSDFPSKEANLLGPMLHLLLDKAEEIARKTELPPQYPNDQDKYDKDLWSLEPNKPEKFKMGIEMEGRHSAISTASSIGASTDSGSTASGTSEGGVVSKDGYSFARSSTVSGGKRDSTTLEINIEDNTQDERSPARSPAGSLREKGSAKVTRGQNKSGKVTKKSSGSSKGGDTASRKGKLKDYRAVASKTRKLKKGTPSQQSSKKGSSRNRSDSEKCTTLTESGRQSSGKKLSRKMSPRKGSVGRKSPRNVSPGTSNASEGQKAERKGAFGAKSPINISQKGKAQREQAVNNLLSVVTNQRATSPRHTEQRSLQHGKQQVPMAPSSPARRSKANLDDYFQGINPDNRVYFSVFKLRRRNAALSTMSPTQRTQKPVPETPLERSFKTYKPLKTLVAAVDRRGESAVEMIDMPTEPSIPLCPVHKPPSQCEKLKPTFELPLGCARKSFRTRVQAWKDDHSFWLPVKATLRRLKKRDGVDVKCVVYTQSVPDANPLMLRAHCPHYKAKRVWVNGEMWPPQ